jgi:hypothetical protein
MLVPVDFFKVFGFFRLVQYGSLWVLFVAFGERFYEGLISILNPEMLLGR